MTKEPLEEELSTFKGDKERNIDYPDGKLGQE